MRVLFISLFVVVADQISKIFIKGINIPFLNINIIGMNERESVNVFGDFFKITFVENPGMAFGIGVSTEIKLLLSLFSLAASIGIIYYMYKSKDQRLILRFALALILGGAVGNLIDRTFYGVIYGYAPIFFGNVVDFLNVEFFDFNIFGQSYERFPIFNIADSAVSVGVVLLLLFNKIEVSDVEKKSVDEDSGSENTKLPSENSNLETNQSAFDSNVEINSADDSKTIQLENGKYNNREENKD
ncbi:MAG: signal peptidase II [bacterium]